MPAEAAAAAARPASEERRRQRQAAAREFRDEFGRNTNNPVLEVSREHLDRMGRRRGRRRRGGDEDGEDQGDSEDDGEKMDVHGAADEVEEAARMLLRKKGHEWFYRKPRVFAYIDPFTKQLLRTKETRGVGWQELFFDLIFVSAIGALGHELSANGSWAAVGEFAIIFLAIWQIWNSTTMYLNRFENQDVMHKLYFLAQMLCVCGAVVGHVGFLSDPSAGLLYGLSIFSSRLLSVGMYAQVYYHLPIARPTALLTILVHGFIALCSLAGAIAAVLGAPQGVLVGLFMVAPLETLISFPLFRVAIATQMGRRILAGGEPMYWIPLAIEHAIERFGLFTIVCLGELIVAALATSATHITGPVVAASTAAVLIAYDLQWIYFDVEGGRQEVHALRRHWLTGMVWLAAHAPLHGGIIVMAAGMLPVIGNVVQQAAYDYALSHASDAERAAAGLSVPAPPPPPPPPSTPMATTTTTAASAPAVPDVVGGGWGGSPSPSPLLSSSAFPSVVVLGASSSVDLASPPTLDPSAQWLLAAGAASTLFGFSLLGTMHHSLHNMRLRWELRVAARVVAGVVLLLLPLAGLSGAGLLYTVAAVLSLTVIVEVYGTLWSRHKHWWTSHHLHDEHDDEHDHRQHPHHHPDHHDNHHNLDDHDCDATAAAIMASAAKTSRRHHHGRHHQAQPPTATTGTTTTTTTTTTTEPRRRGGSRAAKKQQQPAAVSAESSESSSSSSSSSSLSSPSSSAGDDASASTSHDSDWDSDSSSSSSSSSYEENNIAVAAVAASVICDAQGFIDPRVGDGAKLYDDVEEDRYDEVMEALSAVEAKAADDLVHAAFRYARMQQQMHLLRQRHSAVPLP